MNPEILRFETQKSMIDEVLFRLSGILSEIRNSGKKPSLALPTGNTMVPIYSRICEEQDVLQTASWLCFQLDEYHLLPEPEKHREFKSYLDSNLYSKLRHKPELMECLNGQAAEPASECVRYEEKIKSVGGLDLAILGIGTNGHIAFNEPGSDFSSRTRVVTLHPSTLLANFRGGAPVSHALTIGIGTLLEARKIWVIATGISKSKAVRQAILEPANSNVPASALKLHPRVTWFLDQDSAALLSGNF